jgi:hypothetical protein
LAFFCFFAFFFFFFFFFFHRNTYSFFIFFFFTTSGQSTPRRPRRCDRPRTKAQDSWLVPVLSADRVQPCQQYRPPLIPNPSPHRRLGQRPGGSIQRAWLRCAKCFEINQSSVFFFFFFVSFHFLHSNVTLHDFCRRLGLAATPRHAEVLVPVNPRLRVARLCIGDGLQEQMHKKQLSNHTNKQPKIDGGGGGKHRKRVNEK